VITNIEPYDLDERVVGPATLTIYVTNADSSSAVCKGMVQYYRRKKQMNEFIFDSNGEIL
jgi:hypothetical protein